MLLVFGSVDGVLRIARADSLADEAEVNFQLGAERYRVSEFRAALAYFLASNRLAPNDNVRFNIARTFQRLGQYPEAYRWCEIALSGDIEPQLRAQLEETRSAIAREVAVIELVTDPPGATVYLDRQDLGRVAVSPARIAVAPGKHRLIVALEGYDMLRTQELALVAAETRALSLKLTQIVGRVEVKAEAPTLVFTDDALEPSCTTPCTFTLPEGSHVLRFRREGFSTRSERVRVQALSAVSVQVEATPLTGSILVTSLERDALIEIDGVPKGFCPTVVPDVSVGMRVVRVSAPGFRPVEQRVWVSEREQIELRDVSLVPLRQVTAAARVTQTIDEAPASVSVISEREIAAFRYPTLYEALRGQRGVTLSNDGVYPGVALRGLGQPGDYGNRILVLSDGATLNDNILWQSFVGYDGRVDLGDVGGIEVVRGPGSVLYGTGAVSGVVNLLPRGRPERMGGEAQLGVQNARTARGRVAAAMPVGSDGSLRLSASAAHSGGEDVTLQTTPQPTAITNLRKFDAATGNARFTLGPWTVQAFVTTRKQDLPHGAYGAVVGAKPNELQDTRGLAEVRYEPSLGQRLKLYTRAYGNLYTYSNAQTYPSESAAASRGTFVARERYEGRWFGGEARLALELSPSVHLSLGGEASSSVRARLRGKSAENGVQTQFLRQDAPYQIYAAYGLLSWRTGPRLTLSAGGRVDSWSTFGATLNPRAAALIRLSARDTLKIMGGRAFRAPSVYELRYNDGGATQVASGYLGYKLGPELVWSSEIEYTHAFQRGWSALGAAHFQYAERLIEQVELPAGEAPGLTGMGNVVRYQNRGNNVYIAGGDVEVRREFSAGWMFAANYTYLFARATGSGNVLSRVPNVPTYATSVRGVAPLGSGFRVALRTSLEAPRKCPGESCRETGYALITDVVLSGEVERVGLDYSLGIYNLFDWRHGLPTDSTFVTATMPQPGRSLLATLSFRY